MTPPRIGLTHELTFVVESVDLVDFAGDGMPAVLSTPRLIAHLERTARFCLAPCLEPDEQTVGMEIELRHLAPTPAGALVTCMARVVAREERTVTLQLEARDHHELIARGLHKRAVIRVASFSRRVSAKLSGSEQR